MKTGEQIQAEIDEANKLRYPTELVAIIVNVEEFARRLYFQSQPWDRWDGRWWGDLTEDERQTWMEQARKELEGKRVGNQR